MKFKRDQSLGALGLASFMLFSAFMGYSILIPSEDTSAAEDTAETLVSASINPTIAITIEGADETGTLSMDVDNVTGTNMGTGVIITKVSTNDPDGYSLFINTDKADNALTQNGVTDRISALTGETAIADFPENAWGYSTDGGNTYYPVQPSTLNPDEYPEIIDSARRAKNHSGISLNDQTEVTISAKVKGSIASGTYSNTVVFTAIPNSDINRM